MQIGARWGAGGTPHPSVPEQLLPQISDLDAGVQAGSWTLTWLEGRPVCRRDDDTIVTVSAAGEVHVLLPGEEDEDDDSWLD